MRVRIALDTNVVVSALLWRGAPHHLLAAIGRQQRMQIYSSTALLEELADVLTRPSASKRLALIGKTAREVLSDYVDIVELVEPTSVPRVVAADIDDDQVIATRCHGPRRSDRVGGSQAFAAPGQPSRYSDRQRRRGAQAHRRRVMRTPQTGSWREQASLAPFSAHKTSTTQATHLRCDRQVAPNLTGCV